MTAIVMECLEASQHPNAESLRVYKFGCERGEVRIVGNMENVYEVGDRATIVLADCMMNDAEGTQIRVAKIRGCRSHGMALGKTDLAVNTDLTHEYCEPPPPYDEKFKGFVFKSWPSIGALANVRKDLKATSSLRTVKYRGKVKIDGTNAAVQVRPNGDICAQSRNRLLSTEHDNCGFAHWVDSNKDIFTPLAANQDFTIFGEWCFHYDTPILLSDGSIQKIGNIVKNKLPVEVLSFNFKTQKLEPKKVIDWIESNPKEDNWITIHTKKRHRGGKSTKITVTKDHKIYCKKNSEIKEIPAKDLLVGDTVFTFGQQLSYSQKQFIIGSLLGDGTSPNYGTFATSHSKKQNYYNKFINKLFNSIKSNTKELVSGFGSDMVNISTVSLAEIKNIQDLLYTHNKKSPSKKYLNLMHAQAFAAWYMDDGSLCKVGVNRQPMCELSTLGFSQKENEEIVEWFNEHNFECYMCQSSKNKNQFFVRFSPKGTDAFLRMIAPYIIKQFNYKLPKYLKNINKVGWDTSDFKEGIIETQIISITEGVDRKSKAKLCGYDLTISGNHNYFANKLLVHNCGSGIQSNSAAIAQIGKKIFTIFALQIEDGELPFPLNARIIFKPSEIIRVLEERGGADLLQNHDVYVLPWSTGEIDLDFTSPELLKDGAEKVNAIVASVEKCDPWVDKHFNIQGAGEGVVMYPINDDTYMMREDFVELLFKAKGEKHKVTKQKEPVQIDPEVQASVDEFVQFFVTENRLNQIAKEVKGDGDFDIKKTGHFVKALTADVQKESTAELEASNLEWKQVAKGVSSAAQTWWKDKVNEL